LTERLYYNDSFAHEFEGRVASVSNGNGRTAITLDRSAFYPASGGQVFDTGWIVVPDGESSVRLHVNEVAENEQTGEVIHYVEAETASLKPGTVVHGTVNAERRRDHMQQHSGQHVLSAAFEKLYGFATVSFHMGEESCTIDLGTEAVSAGQIRATERLANEIIAEDRPVDIKFASIEEARAMGVRKIPAAEREKLRLIDIREFDLNACGGTHVRSTGQIGSILLRKTEKVKQGVRVEFVCGLRAVATARRDYETLTESAALFSTHVYEVPQGIRKLQDENKAAAKTQHKLLEELAELQARQMLDSAEQRGAQKLVVQFFANRDLGFIKMLAQKLTRLGHCVALLACGGPQPSLVFAQTPGLGNDMGALMKQAVQALGMRGGGNRDMAQGGAPDGQRAEQAIHESEKQIA
jgi:alanyl-tRNA synthetase